MLLLVGATGMLAGQTAPNTRGECESSRSVDAQIAACTEVIRVAKDPSAVPAKVYENRAQAYEQKGEHDLAIADMDTFIRLDGTTEGYSERGMLELANGDYRHALVDFDKMEQTGWRSYALRGLANVMAGNYAAAEGELTKALAASPDNVRLVLLLYVAQSRGGKDGWENLLQNSLKLKGTSWPTPLAGLLAQGALQAQILQAAADSDPLTTRDHDRVAYYYLGQQAMIEGHVAEAQTLFRQVIALGRPPLDKDSSVEYMAAEAELRGKTSIPPIQIAGVGPAERGLIPQTAPVATTVSNGNYYALVIGINRYPAPVRPLQTAVHDAEAIAKDLQDLYGFRVTLLRDGEATRARIITAIRGYRNALGPNDNLLIYYAGHGFSDKEADKAYWLPVDADSVESPNAIIADDLTTDVRVQNARHVLIISDSCYSGGLTRDVDTRPPTTEQQAYVLKMLGGKSRTLMASGGDEPVSDKGADGHSVFANAVLQALEHPEQTMFTASDLFYHSVLQRVAGSSAQTPEYDFIKNSGHDNGDFVFVRR